MCVEAFLCSHLARCCPGPCPGILDLSDCQRFKAVDEIRSLVYSVRKVSSGKGRKLGQARLKSRPRNKDKYPQCSRLGGADYDCSKRSHLNDGPSDDIRAFLSDSTPCH